MPELNNEVMRQIQQLARGFALLDVARDLRIDVNFVDEKHIEQAQKAFDYLEENGLF